MITRIRVNVMSLAEVCNDYLHNNCRSTVVSVRACDRSVSWNSRDPLRIFAAWTTGDTRDCLVAMIVRKFCGSRYGRGSSSCNVRYIWLGHPVELSELWQKDCAAITGGVAESVSCG